MNIYYF